MKVQYDRNSQTQTEANLRNKSLQGSTGTRKNTKVTMDIKKYHANLRRTAIATAIATGLILGAGSSVVTKMQEDHVVDAMTKDFKECCLDTTAQNAANPEDYYLGVTEYIENMYDFDIGMYLLNANTNDAETDRILSYTYYGSLDNYLDSIHYEDIKDWKDDMYDRIVKDDEIYNKKVELRDMLEGHRNEVYGQEDRAGLLH